MTTATKEEQPPVVPAGATQGGEPRARWAWVEPSVWTERMLAALENGVKGGRWFSLRDKVHAPKNLAAAWAKVQTNRGAAGVDGQSIELFGARADKYLDELHQALAALRNVLEPLWEKQFVSHSYGFRPGRGCRHALRRVAELLESGHVWVVDADIQSFFDMIDHSQLMGDVEKVVSDGAVLELVERFLKQRVMDEMKTWTPELGTPQGAVISPLLANIYLHPVDVALKGEGHEVVRYADDLVILCRSEEEAHRALELLQRAMAERKLTLHPEKTRLVDASQPGGFDFLGYHFECGRRTPRKKSLAKLRDSVRAQTRRTNGHSLERTIEVLNPVLRGWFQYFKHCRSWVFKMLDGWVRMRLRSILRRRHHGRGAGRGLSNIRWPNAYFADLGLFTMTAAWDAARRSR